MNTRVVVCACGVEAVNVFYMQSMVVERGAWMWDVVRACVMRCMTCDVPYMMSGCGMGMWDSIHGFGCDIWWVYVVYYLPTTRVHAR